MKLKIILLSAIALSEVAIFAFLLLYTEPMPMTVVPAYNAPTNSKFIIPARYRAWVTQYAAEFGIPLDIAIRLAYEESRWDEKAMRSNTNGTFDHNLYQTNSKFFSVKLTQAHIREALRHFAWCWKVGGNLTNGVLIYNSGLSGSQYRFPKSLALAHRVVGGQL